MTATCRCGAPSNPKALTTFLRDYCDSCRSLVVDLILNGIVYPDRRHPDGRARREALHRLLDAGREFEEKMR